MTRRQFLRIRSKHRATADKSGVRLSRKRGEYRTRSLRLRASRAMRRSRLVVIILLCLLVSAAGIGLYLKLRKPAPTQFDWKSQVASIAGNGSPLFSEVPQATHAGFSDPFGIAIGSDGSVYISDAGDSNRIRRVTPEGTLQTVAGDKEGFADGIPASFNTPSGVAIDSEGNLYVADTGNNRI